MTTKPPTSASGSAPLLPPLSSSAHRSWGSTHSTLEPTRTPNFSPGHSHPSLTTPRNPAPNRETPLNPQNQLPLASRSPLPHHTSTQVAKLAPKQHHSGTSTCGHMRSIPGTQKTS